jgi:hypothetical protein
LAARFAVAPDVALLVVRFADLRAALRDADFDLPRADVFAALRAFFAAARLTVAFLAEDFFVVFRAVCFFRGGCAATGGTSSGSDTSPSAANGM